jgi:hypothetical protein
MAHNANSFPDVLTENNYKSIEKEFLKYADSENYEGVYEFTKEGGLQLDWGKYDYSVNEEEQEPDMRMLELAIIKFNREFAGRYIAFGDMGDKYNSVNILDIQQLSNNKVFLDAVKSVSNYVPYKTALELIEKFSPNKSDNKNENYDYT